MKPFLWILGVWIAAILCLQAESPYNTTPELALAFPMEERKEGVGVQFPILINTTTVVPTDGILRVIYIPPKIDDKEVKVAVRKSEQEVAYTKQSPLDIKNSRKLSPKQEATLRMAREVVWPKTTMFQLALANLSSQDMRLVFLDPKTLDLIDELLNFPEGLVLGQKDAKIVVLAVEKTSNGEKAGVQAGDEIVQWGGQKPEGNLNRFVAIYNEAKKTAKESGARAIEITVRSANASEERKLSIPLPISLQGSLLDTPLGDAPSTPAPPALPGIYNK